MDDIQMLEAVERYIRGEMKPDERVYFEQLRKSNPEIDQLVVEHTLFIHKMNELGELKGFRTRLHEIHVDLAEKGQISSAKLKGKAKVVYLWKRYKRVAAIAASIAGITTLTISALVWSLTPSAPTKEIEQLNSKYNELARKDRELNNEINKVKTKISTPVYKTGGTSFLVDGKGYLVTNAHVVQNAKIVVVQNKKGEEFSAKIVHINTERDIAILKIDDEDFKPYSSIPYAIRKSSTDRAEPVFTLGFPRNEIVYGEGYLSAITGFNDDTLSYQIAIAANPGNSGGPVLNKNGEVIGILSTRQTTAEGVVFATQAKYIYKALEDLKKDTTYQSVKAPSGSVTLKNLDRVQQVKKIEDYIYMVKVN